MSAKTFDSIKLKDTHYLAKWDKNDLPKVRKFADNIREYQEILSKLKDDDPLKPQLEAEKKEISDNFYNIFEKNLNDHHNQPLDPLNVSVDRKYIMTWRGIAKMCRLITKQDSDTFTGAAIGIGSTVPQPYDTLLVNEIKYIDFATNGFFDSAGISIRYCGTFGEGVETQNNPGFTESLVRNQASPTNAIILCRNIFANNPISHTSGQSGFSAAGIIEFIPVVD